MVASHFLRKPPPRKVFEKMYLFSQERGFVRVEHPFNHK